MASSSTTTDQTASTTPVVGYKGDPSRLRPPSKQFQCQERIATNDDDEYGISVVAFQSRVATQPSLLFHCREPSCGVLRDEEPAAVKEEDGAMDPSFFDPGYTLAGKTGFQVWPGSRIVVEGLLLPCHETDPEELKNWQGAIREGSRVLELGSGVGIVGASLAQAGAEVLLTDLPTLVTESLEPNLQRNSTKDTETNGAPPSWLSSNTDGILPIGKGWVSSAALDWTVPVPQQLSNEQCQVDLVIASDCVWLVSMLEGLFSSVQAIFDASERRNPKLLMSFQRRDPKEGTESKMFTTVDRVLNEIQARKWKVDCLAWHPVVYEVDGVKDDSKEVFLFLVRP